MSDDTFLYRKIVRKKSGRMNAKEPNRSDPSPSAPMESRDRSGISWGNQQQHLKWVNGGGGGGVLICASAC